MYFYVFSVDLGEDNQILWIDQQRQLVHKCNGLHLDEMVSLMVRCQWRTPRNNLTNDQTTDDTFIVNDSKKYHVQAEQRSKTIVPYTP
jgi:hypothetical protein